MSHEYPGESQLPLPEAAQSFGKSPRQIRYLPRYRPMPSSTISLPADPASSPITTTWAAVTSSTRTAAEPTTAFTAVASAKSGSMLYFEDFYAPMRKGMCIGDAYLNWWRGCGPVHDPGEI